MTRGGEAGARKERASTITTHTEREREEVETRGETGAESNSFQRGSRIEAGVHFRTMRIWFSFLCVLWSSAELYDDLHSKISC